MNPMQTTGIHATSPRPVTNADLLQLSYRENAVLSGRDPGDLEVRRGIGEFSSHVGR
jgi:hypothetical protein